MIYRPVKLYEILSVKNMKTKSCLVFLWKKKKKKPKNTWFLWKFSSLPWENEKKFWVFSLFFSFSCEARLLLSNILYSCSRGKRHKFHQCGKYLVLEGNVGYIFISFLISHNLSFLGGCIMLEKYFNKNGLWFYHKQIFIEEKCLQVHPLFLVQLADA